MRKEILVKTLGIVRREFNNKIEELDKQFEKFMIEENIDTQIDLDYQEKIRPLKHQIIYSNW